MNKSYSTVCKRCIYCEKEYCDILKCSDFYPYRKQVIVCAANKLASGLIVCGARHHDPIMNAQIKAAGDTHIGETQGFIDQYGRFMNRKDAYRIAEESGQIVRSIGYETNKLFSEHLY